MIDFRLLDGRTDFYFLRHGESEGNSARRIQGRGDYPLSEAGREQARRVSGWLADKGIRRVLTSPLARAAETALIVAGELGLPAAQTLAELNELDTGRFTGLTVEEIRGRFPEAWRSFQRESWEGVPGAERAADLEARAGRMWEHLAALAEEGAHGLLCVTHSGTMQWVLKTTFGCRTWMPVVPMGNCAVCRFSVDNRLREDPVRHYAEWSLVNYQPFRDLERGDHLFLKR
jgi:broad specificity phosphatase PhoE